MEHGPRVTFSGYSIPHPADARVNIRRCILKKSKIACPELRVLAIGWVPNITDVWDKKLLPRGSFCQLREMRIEGCDKLVNVIPSNMLPRLQNLTELSVQYCPMVEEILSEKEEEKVDAEAKENIILFPQLKTLELGSLENLESFCTSRLAAQHFFKHSVELPVLEDLFIYRLRNLEVLNVYSRLKMLAIVLEEEGKEKDDENTILFPQLTTLNLKSLDNLKTFYTQVFLNYQTNPIIPPDETIPITD
ncbi:hypothetical protein ACSBR2_041555 [Camellia fascicularis]